uniref:GTPase n=1 Tax=Eiseniibacteriota bacterium TaxID=2212470 RepID=A0A832I4X0_UNCEI
MTDREREAVAALCLMAAFADGSKADRERDQLKEIFESIGGGATASVYHRVVLKKIALEDEAAALGSSELRALAYELAVSVCDADGAASDAERAYLERLRAALGLGAAQAERVMRDAEALASAPLEAAAPAAVAHAAPPAAAPAAAAGPVAVGTALPPAPAPLVPAAAAAMAGAAAGAPGGAAPDPREAEVDGLVLRHAILAGGLELLPQNLSTLAIIPLQMRMTYEIGKRYGFTLDRGHVQDFLGTVGIGMTSQVVEQFARKFLGKAVKKVAGKGAGKLASAAAGPAITFATTYGLGMVAKRYYAGGRRLDASALRAAFDEQMARGQQLFDRHRGDVEASARRTGPLDVMGWIRG